MFGLANTVGAYVGRTACSSLRCIHSPLYSPSQKLLFLETTLAGFKTSSESMKDYSSWMRSVKIKWWSIRIQNYRLCTYTWPCRLANSPQERVPRSWVFAPIHFRALATGTLLDSSNTSFSCTVMHHLRIFNAQSLRLTCVTLTKSALFRMCQKITWMGSAFGSEWCFRNFEDKIIPKLTCLIAIFLVQASLTRGQGKIARRLSSPDSLYAIIQERITLQNV